MARVAGVDLPPNKRAQIGMTYIYGVGRSRATSILGQAGVDINAKIKDISED
ncbi:MAG: 30S ribosomal protein S13, partial [Acidobacteria bacterium]|nr:30S ribosomal protein S13 [Acidobacteriota bacterium]